MIRKYYLLILLFGLAYMLAMARVGAAVEWEKIIGGSKDDIANDVLLMSNGGYVIAGTSKSNDGNVSGHHGSTDPTDAWEKKMNWGGHSLPVATTRMIIPANTAHLPVLRSKAICYQVKQDATAVLTIAAGYQLTVTGNEKETG